MTYLIVIVLIMMSALFSGLTLGFFSLNKDDLGRKAELGDKQAKKVYSVRKNGNLLLCTLLIGNVAVNSVLAIFLGSIASGVAAGLLATGLIVIFGEIVPQAAFSRYALALGSRLVWLVRIFLIILFPICWPLAWILDKVLGDELDTVYSKRELIKMIEKHEDLSESEIDEDEERIIKGGLSYSEKTAQDIMTPRVEMVALKKEQRLDKKTLAKVVATGHSRIPIYKERMDNVIGILYVKDLIGVDLKNKTAGSLARKNTIFVDSLAFLDNLLEDFKRTRNHLFVVIDKYNSVVGVVTIEDVLEEIIGAEIVDEFDDRVDLQEQAKKKAKKRTRKS